MHSSGFVRFGVILALCTWSATANGQTVISTDTTYDGQNVPLTGTLSINGAGSPTLTLLNGTTLTAGLTSLTVGNTQNGALVIAGGSVLSNSGATNIGMGSTSTGSVTVTGAGSQWNTGPNSFFLGRSGTGNLLISSGGVVNTGSGATLGFSSTGVGNATITGAGSRWSMTGDLNVGSSGSGTLTVTGGGQVFSNFGGVGGVAGNGTATISGLGSAWTMTSLLSVGSSVTGTLTIGDGGQVTTLGAVLGQGSTGVGGITVTGVGSLLTATSAITIGQGNQGVVQVLNGGRIVSGGVSLGFAAGTGGTVLVSGTNSRWTASGNLAVGSTFGGAGALTITGGGIFEVAGQTQVYGAGSLTIGSGGTLTTASLLGNVTNNGVLTVGDDFGIPAAYSDVISGTGSVYKTGSGTVIFTAAQTYSGGTTITAGTLQVGNNSAGASIAGNVWNDGTLQYAVSDSQTFSGTIGGPGGLVKLNDGTLSLSATNSYSGGTTIGGGTLRLVGGDDRLFASGTVTLTGGTLDVSGSQTVGTVILDSASAITGTGVLKAPLFDVRSGTISAQLGGGGNLQKSTTATVTIGGGNSYSGGTSILAGTLLVAGNGALGSGSVLIGDTSGFNPAALLINGNFTVDRAITVQAGGAGAISLGGANTSGTSTFTGSILLNKDVTLTAAGGGIVEFRTGTISGIGGINKSGLGTAVLSGAETYGGTTTISAGALRALDGVGLPTGSNLVLAGGVFESSGNFNRALGSGANQLRWSFAGGGFSAAGADLTVNIGGAAQSLTWGQFNFVGIGSSLAFGSGTADARTQFVNALNLGGGVRTISVSDNSAVTTDYAELSGILSNGGLNKTGAGLLVLSGNNTYASGTTIVAGTLRAAHNHALGTGSVIVQDGGKLDVANGITIDNTLVIQAGGSLGGGGAINSNVTIAAGGTVSPGNSPGTQTVASETWAAGGNYLWEMNDVDAGMGTDPGWDWINISNQLNITATSGGKFNVLITSLDLSNAPGPVHDFNPFSNYSWTIATAGGGVNGFDANAFLLDTSGFQNSFSGSFAIALIGNDVRLNYTASAVPEPTSLLLVVAGAGGMIWRRRRRRKVRTPDTATPPVAGTC